MIMFAAGLWIGGWLVSVVILCKLNSYEPLWWKILTSVVCLFGWPVAIHGFKI